MTRIGAEEVGLNPFPKVTMATTEGHEHYVRCREGLDAVRQGGRKVLVMVLAIG
jgi:hypothetical protein